MDPILFQQMSALEDVHWWFRGRRAILNAAIKRLPLSPQSTILEAGCGTGGNLTMLSQHGLVEAMEYDPIAKKLADRRRVCPVVAGELPNGIPFPARSFDLVALFDVLEHLDEDVATLKTLRQRLTSEGWLILTVPANPWMWSHHDEVHHHRRRYTLGHLKSVVKNSGYQIHYAGYFNFLLFPLIASIRLLQKSLNRTSPKSDLTLPNPIVNQLLTWIFSAERIAVHHRISIPFGVSLLLVARPQQD